MIPAPPAAAAVGFLLMVLAALVGALLLVWWGWRHWHARRGTPRPVMRGWQWALATMSSVLPISMAVMLLQWYASEVWRERQEARQDRIRFITLPQSVPWGDVVLPAGSHAQRNLLGMDEVLKGDATDLLTLTDIRFGQAVPVGDLSITAMSLLGPRLLLELARHYRFGGQDCPAGYLLQFKARAAPIVLEDVPVPVYQAQPLYLTDWVFESCFDSMPIAVRYWKNGVLVWADAPDYEKAP